MHVEKQTHKNLEVIIIDDCSKFSPEYIISQFKSLNIRYFRNKTNSKVAYSTNKGVKLAKGEYIALLGDDDEWTSKSKIETSWLHKKFKNQKLVQFLRGLGTLMIL